MTQITITVPGTYRIDGRNTDCEPGDVCEATHREAHALVNGGYAEYITEKPKREQRPKAKPIA